MVVQLAVGRSDDDGRFCRRVEHDDRVHAFLAVSCESDDRRFLDSRHTVDHTLDVVGEHVEPLRCHDDLLLSPKHLQSALVVECAEVAGVEPAGLEHRRGIGRGAEVTGGDVIALDEDLAVVCDPDLDTGNRCADRPPSCFERVVERYDRRGLGEAVTLYHQEPEPGPERLEVGVEGRGADNEAPELHPKQSVDSPVAPPTSGHIRGVRRRLGHLRGNLQHVLSQHIEDLGDAHQHRDPAALNLVHDGRGAVSPHEHTDTREHRRDERSQRLTEHVA